MALGALAADLLGMPFGAGLLFPVKPSAVLAMGAGDLVASARDVAALAAAVVNGRLLPPESTREMLAPYVQCGPETWQGPGVQIEYHGPVRMVGHGGTFPGFDAAAYTAGAWVLPPWHPGPAHAAGGALPRRRHRYSRAGAEPHRDGHHRGTGRLRG